MILSLDLSTQSLKCTLHAVKDGSSIDVPPVVFGTDLAADFPNTHGYNVGANGHVTSPTLMFVAALDIMLDRLARMENVDLGLVTAVSGCGQQHGSVYWSGLPEAMPADMPLKDLLSESFAIANSPIWMDTSTTAECKEFSKA
ncbi:MAG: hypothetical protein SGCHY_003792, partial [Lobulomycetales sp.]